MKTLSQKRAALAAQERRLREIYHLRALGWSLQRIGDRLKLTRQRIAQILAAER